MPTATRPFPLRSSDVHAAVAVVLHSLCRCVVHLRIVDSVGWFARCLPPRSPHMDRTGAGTPAYVRFVDYHHPLYVLRYGVLAALRLRVCTRSGGPGVAAMPLPRTGPSPACVPRYPHTYRSSSQHRYADSPPVPRPRVPLPAIRAFLPLHTCWYYRRCSPLPPLPFVAVGVLPAFPTAHTAPFRYHTLPRPRHGLLLPHPSHPRPIYAYVFGLYLTTLLVKV